MRVLLNYCGFLKPATIITGREQFSECQNALFIADMCHLKNRYYLETVHLKFYTIIVNGLTQELKLIYETKKHKRRF